MRWKALFDDLEAQAEAAERTELDAEVRDRTRREGGLLRTADRCRAAIGGLVVLTVHGPGVVRGRLLDAGADWLLLEEPAGHDALVPLAAVLAVGGLTRRAEPAEGELAARLDLRWALRGLTRDRAVLQVVLRDGTALAGTLDRVAADYVDLAEHPQGELRRAGAVSGVRLLPLTAIGLLRSV